MLNTQKIAADLAVQGFSLVSSVVNSTQCEQLKKRYSQENLYRSRIDMARYNFGRGEYKYYSYPLPDIVQELRQTGYHALRSIANHWHKDLGFEARFPARYGTYINRCHRTGQVRPTPLILKYGAEDYNCLHQDLYGDNVFPLQMAVLLSEPEVDFGGGEFVLSEQRPRMQSRVQVVPLEKGDGVVFPVRFIPRQGRQRVYRATMRHGISQVRWGERYALGIILHDAE